jgi:anaerobic ribonucleoside-triphosphate reductase activating protein
MNYAYMEIGLQEVPSEIALCIGITGCTVHCPGCHSKELWQADYGSTLTDEVYVETLKKYEGKCSCICFMGGDQYKDELIELLIIARIMGFKTALYTGEYWVYYDIQKYLDYVKFGPFIESLGGLAERTTNQRMYKIENGALIDITSSFWRD